MNRTSPGKSEWEFRIDVGGTIVDCPARRPDGTVSQHKLLTGGVYKRPLGSPVLFSGSDFPCSERDCLVSLSFTEWKTVASAAP